MKLSPTVAKRAMKAAFLSGPALLAPALRSGSCTAAVLPWKARFARSLRVRMMASASVPVQPATEPVEPVRLKVVAEGPLEFVGDTLLLGLVAPAKGDDEEEEAEFGLPEGLARLDEKLSGAISGLVEDTEFKGVSGSSEMTRVTGPGSLRRVCIFGLGQKGEDGHVDAVTMGKLATHAVSTAKGAKTAKDVGIWVDSPISNQMMQSASDAAAVASFTEDRFKSERKDKDKDQASISILGAEEATLQEYAKRGEAIGLGVVMTKQLVMSPPNVLNPGTLAETAAAIASEHKLDIKIMEREECAELGMGAYLGVSQGSAYPPKFIHMTYNPEGGASRRIALIGKGLTFDSGGYNIKAGAGSMIELMKFDMGGSGAVLGAAKAIGEIRPNDVQVDFIVAACENMVSDAAYRPGDILTASNGTTIEIGNTDAEGRLTLADALVYADKLENIDCIIDMATLTGAIIISLGNDYAGLFTPNDDMALQIEEAAKTAGEKMWRMPMPEEYLELTKSKVADLKNTGGRAGGSITAALFLKEFVKSPWAHLDIAGTVWADKAGGPTGYGVRTLVEFVESYKKV